MAILLTFLKLLLQTCLLCVWQQHLHWLNDTKLNQTFLIPQIQDENTIPNMINRAVINVMQINSLRLAVSATYLSNAVWQFFPDDSQLAPSILMSNYQIADWGRFPPLASSSRWNLLTIINQGHLSISTRRTHPLQNYVHSKLIAIRKLGGGSKSMLGGCIGPNTCRLLFILHIWLTFIISQGILSSLTRIQSVQPVLILSVVQGSQANIGCRLGHRTCSQSYKHNYCDALFAVWET